jgi:hypothetical protein
MGCLKTNGPLGFSPNEPFAGPSKLSAVIASEGSRAASNGRGRIQLGRLIGSAPYCCGHSEAKQRRADKFEELVAAVYEFDHWVQHIGSPEVNGRDIPQTVSPFAKLQSISSVYFPQFNEAIRELDSAFGSAALTIRSPWFYRLRHRKP